MSAAGWPRGEGPIEIGLPQVRNAGQAVFRSEILEGWKQRSEAVERLIPALYVKGLSTRDTEAVLQETLGNGACSKSTVSRVCQALVQEFEAWKNRDLSDYPILYLFLDAIYLALRQGTQEKEGVLAAYGITVEGKKVLLHLGLGQRESYDAWLSFLQDMKQRGLKEPLLVVMDGNAGLKKAVRHVFPKALRQRCLAHKMRNVLAKTPRKMQTKMKQLVRRCLEAKDYGQGKRLMLDLIATWKDRYPSAMECLEKDLEECLVFLRFPEAHRKRIRTTNLLERLFGEGKRRTKVIPRFPTEQSTLSLLYSTLVDASKSWRGVRMTPESDGQLWLLWQEQYPEAQPDHAKRAA
jgi:transposase-like protein